MSAQAATNASAEASADAAALLQFRALLLLRAPAEVLDARVRGHHRVSDTLRRLRASPLARDPTYMETAAAAQGALACWHALWARDPRLNRVLGKKSLFKEMEEAVVAVAHVLRVLSARPCAPPHVVLDCCAGKGIASMLLATLLRADADRARPRAPRCRLVAVDLSSGGSAVRLDHLDAVAERPGRVISGCHFSVQLNHFIPAGFLSYSVPVFLN